MPEADSEQEVYYEDLISPLAKPERSTTSPKVKETESKAASASASAPDEVPAQGNAVSNPLKRQRTLVDMFSGPSAKKTKVGGPSTAVVSKSQTLNSIPFNLSGFINSLAEEQRDLLSLEVEAMGKSWSVSTSPPLPQNTVSMPHLAIPLHSSCTDLKLPLTAQAEAPT